MRVILLGFCLLISCQRGYDRPEYKAKQEALTRYGEKMANDFGMRLLIVGNVTPHFNIPYAMSFMSSKQMSLEEAKPFAKQVLDTFLTLLAQDSAVQQYAFSHQAPSTGRAIGLKISFWDRDMNRVAAPFVAEIHFYEDTFYFYSADPVTQELRLILKEEGG